MLPKELASCPGGQDMVAELPEIRPLENRQLMELPVLG